MGVTSHPVPVGALVHISPEVETPFSMSHTVSGRPFMVQRNGLAMVWLK